MEDYVSIADGAKTLGLSESRVRALAESGKFRAQKVAGRWLLDKGSVNKRSLENHPSGRPLEPHNAWALLLEASGMVPEGIDPAVRSRLRRALRSSGLEGMEPRLAKRANVRHYFAHPGELSHLAEDPILVLSGVSAAAHAGADVLSGAEADGYLEVPKLDEFVKNHALAESGSRGNVTLRLVPEGSWYFLRGLRFAPTAAVGIDLSEDADPRLSDAGKAVLRALDLERQSAGG